MPVALGRAVGPGSAVPSGDRRDEFGSARADSQLSSVGPSCPRQDFLSLLDRERAGAQSLGQLGERVVPNAAPLGETPWSGNPRRVHVEDRGVGGSADVPRREDLQGDRLLLVHIETLSSVTPRWRVRCPYVGAARLPLWLVSVVTA